MALGIKSFLEDLLHIILRFFGIKGLVMSIKVKPKLSQLEATEKVLSNSSTNLREI